MNKKKIIIIFLILIIIALLIYVLFMKTSNPVEVARNTVKHETVESLYQTVEVSNCTEFINYDQDTNVKDMATESILYIIFNQMQKDKVLKEQITLEEYQISAGKVFQTKLWPDVFENYLYDGYHYTLKEGMIKREKVTCDNQQYISKLYGYSSQDEKLEVDVAVAYVKNNKVYDLNNKEIGNYNENDLNKILDKGTIQVYNYILVNDNYYLNSIGNK